MLATFDIIEKTRELRSLYPFEDCFGNRASLWHAAFYDNVVTEEQLLQAMNYYGKLWNYN